MSEKIYAWLLRFFPSHFQKTYGDEALLLFRDRFRDEKGFFPRLRLWLDLLFDLAISLPREHRRAQHGLVATSTLHHAKGVPSFQVMEEEPLRSGALLLGSVLAVAILSVFLVLFNRIGDRGPMRLSMAQIPPQNEMASSAQQQHADADEETAASGTAAGDAGSRDSNNDKVNRQQKNTLLIPHQLQQPKPQDATSAMIKLFDIHDIVMFGEVHGSEQEYDWLCKLVSNPEFADRVDDIVVEFGNSLYQKTVDRYIAGENVPIEQVQKAWRNMVLSVVPVQPVYEQFYKAVREANLSHHGKHQIRLVLGSPPADWDQIKDHSDLEPYMNEREQWYARVVENEVLAKRHHALLIMGASHFLRGRDQVLQDEILIQQRRAVPPVGTAKLAPGYIERELRAAGANPYLVVFGTNVVNNYGDVDKRFDSWRVPALVPLSGNWVGQLPAQPVTSGGLAPATPLRLADEADAMLYVAPCDSLRVGYLPRTEIDGTPYGKEIARRNMIILGHPENFLHDETEPECVQPKQISH
jgi:hypothetical protein